ncbi:MAG: hypothetical protein ABIK28_12355 [Planctomycetota bacterium]
MSDTNLGPQDRTGKPYMNEQLLIEDQNNLRRLARLKEQGVGFPCGATSVYVGSEVDPARISEGVVLYPGTRITGSRTLINAHAVIGLRGPCVVNDMVIGAGAVLGSGFFEQSVLLDGVKLGASVRVRENCLFEEACEMSFSADVKHTFLLANVVLGSEINFCDIFMSGGTSRKDHSEVGSGVIHFNFTPFGESGDKATASLIGDAVHGVFYRSKRIFVGGHASLIGPLRIGYGSVIAAGARADSDIGEEILTFGSTRTPKDIKGFDFLCYKNIKRKLGTCIEYVAQLAALWHWYGTARAGVVETELGQETIRAALDLIASGIDVRIDRIDRLHSYMDESIARNQALNEDALVNQQKTFKKQWPAFREKLAGFMDVEGDIAERDRLMEAISVQSANYKNDFVALVSQGLDEDAVSHGTAWLQSIVDELTEGATGLSPI